MAHEAAYLLQLALNALQLAAFYLPLALAFALIQAVTGRVFLSFGGFAMFGSFAAVYACFYGILNGFGDLGSALLALSAGIACASALSWAASRMVFQPLLAASAQAYMIGAVGFSIMLEEVMRLQSGGRDIWIPQVFSGNNIVILDGKDYVAMTLPNAVAVGISCGAIVATALFMRLSPFGRSWFACSQDMRLAKLCGINTKFVISGTFVLGSALAAVSGWIVAVDYGGTSFSSGTMLGFKAMFAAVVGGFACRSSQS